MRSGDAEAPPPASTRQPPATKERAGSARARSPRSGVTKTRAKAKLSREALRPTARAGEAGLAVGRTHAKRRRRSAAARKHATAAGHQRARGLSPRAFTAKRRNQDPSESEAFARGAKADG